MPVHKMAKIVSTKYEPGQSAISYLSGSSLASASLLSDVTTIAQLIALSLGCIVVAIRLVHDCIVLVRYIKSGDKKDNRK